MIWHSSFFSGQKIHTISYLYLNNVSGILIGILFTLWLKFWGQLTLVNKTTSNWVICSSRKNNFQYSIEFHQINMLSWNFLAQLMHFRKSSAPTMAIFCSKKCQNIFFSFAGQEEWWFAAAADNCLVKLGSWGRKTEERKKKKLSSREPAIFTKVILYVVWWAIFIKQNLKFGWIRPSG